MNHSPRSAAPAFASVSRVAESIWLLFRRRQLRQNALATLVEWDNDVPPFPIFIGAVAHAKASRPSPMPRRQPHLFV
jgi:uncharacterized protein (UPF0276 family)